MANKNLCVVFAFIAIGLLVFVGSAIALSVELVSDEEEFGILDGGSSGNFLMSTNNGEAIFWGTYNGTSQTMAGNVMWQGSSIVRIGHGIYSPTSPSTGNMMLHFYDPMNLMDPGMNWVGNYSSNVWTISEATNPSVSLSGTAFLTPN